MIYSLTNFAPLAATLRNQGRQLVLATGFFDLLHSEHIKFLHKARSCGDTLIVAVESDARARAVKGKGRPVETQLTRCQKLAHLADYVIALSDDFNHPQAYDSLMSLLRPSVYAVSSHTSHLAAKRTLTEKYGGQLLVVHPWNPQISTTQIIAGNNKL